jgi:ribonuclease HI
LTEQLWLKQAYQKGHQVAKITSKPAKRTRPELLNGTGPIWKSIAVDAACSGNPGVLEYRGVWTETAEELFRQGPFAQGTNNIGEFLALVHALAHLKKEGLNIPIYSDSKIAIGWLKRKKCKTQLQADEQNVRLFELINRAEKWLQDNPYENEILKWDTILWGENPADFGRK